LLQLLTGEIIGDGEYIIYTALAWRNRAFGQGSSFAWAEDSNAYAVLEGKLKIRLWKNFKVNSSPYPSLTHIYHF
jgi:coatomer subunit beta'